MERRDLFKLFFFIILFRYLFFFFDEVFHGMFWAMIWGVVLISSSTAIVADYCIHFYFIFDCAM